MSTEHYQNRLFALETVVNPSKNINEEVKEMQEKLYLEIQKNG